MYFVFLSLKATSFRLHQPAHEQLGSAAAVHDVAELVSRWR